MKTFREYLKKHSSCDLCKHLKSEKNWNCKAYPNGIPVEILNGSVNHYEHYIGDNGYLFEIDEKKIARYEILKEA
jgi:hypothetical protein